MAFNPYSNQKGGEFGCGCHALIKPVDGGTEWLSVPIQIDIHAALRGESHRFDMPRRESLRARSPWLASQNFCQKYSGCCS